MKSFWFRSLTMEVKKETWMRSSPWRQWFIEKKSFSLPKLRVCFHKGEGHRRRMKLKSWRSFREFIVRMSWGCSYDDVNGRSCWRSKSHWWARTQNCNFHPQLQCSPSSTWQKSSQSPEGLMSTSHHCPTYPRRITKEAKLTGTQSSPPLFPNNLRIATDC